MTKKITMWVLGLVAMAAPAMAEGLVDVSTLAVDTDSLGTVGLVILTGLAGIWGFRKLVKSINRS